MLSADSYKEDDDGNGKRTSGQSDARGLFEITQDILQAQEIGTALFSIARGLSELFSFKCVSIVASDVPGGDLSRRVLLVFSDETVRERLGSGSLARIS